MQNILNNIKKKAIAYTMVEVSEKTIDEINTRMAEIEQEKNAEGVIEYRRGCNPR